MIEDKGEESILNEENQEVADPEGATVYRLN